MKIHLDGIRQLIKVLMSPLTDFSRLKELDISLEDEALSTSPCETKPSWKLFTCLENALTNRFENLTTLGLKADAYDLASLLRSVSSELCKTLTSFYCTLTGYYNGDLTDTINAFCQDVS